MAEVATKRTCGARGSQPPATEETPTSLYCTDAARDLRPPGPFPARGRPAEGDRRIDVRDRARRPVPDAPRGDRLRQDDDGRQRRPEHRQADARAVAQQDARGAALRGAEELP